MTANVMKREFLAKAARTARRIEIIMRTAISKLQYSGCSCWHVKEAYKVCKKENGGAGICEETYADNSESLHVHLKQPAVAQKINGGIFPCWRGGLL
jgi:hypothetical protein